MTLPEQIRKQTEAVQELYKQLNAEGDTGAEANVSAENSDAPVANEETSASVAEETVQSEANEAKPDSDNASSEETLLQKYRTLQGMYNAEVPRLHQQNRELLQRVQQLEQLLATLSVQQNNATASSQQQVERYVTDKDVEEYGESIDVMRRVTREELSPINQRLAQVEAMLRQMQANVVPQVQAVMQRQQMSAEQQFWADLAAAIPNFREINDNPAFQSWLLEVDPLTGITRQTYLEDAQRNLDVRRVINIFRAWLDLTGQSVNSRTGELEKQIVPGRSRSSGSSVTVNKAKIYTPQDIQKFFDDVRAGRYKGREQERNRIERDIFAAQREGRIQFT